MLEPLYIKYCFIESIKYYFSTTENTVYEEQNIFSGVKNILLCLQVETHAVKEKMYRYYSLNVILFLK